MITTSNIISVKQYNWGPYWNYQVTHTGGVTGVPYDYDNSDCKVVIQWSSIEGNNIIPADN